MTTPAARLHQAAEECSDDGRGNCACIVAQGRCAEGAAPAVPVRYIADAETPEAAAWIALMHPGVGEAAAAWLEFEATWIDRMPGAELRDRTHHALAVADALLGPEGATR